MTKGKPNLMRHHGSCSFCGRRNLIIINYNYKEQPKNNFKLCAKCLTRGIVAYQEPIAKLIEFDLISDTKEHIIEHKK